jgi:hypothetical protein
LLDPSSEISQIHTNIHLQTSNHPKTLNNAPKINKHAPKHNHSHASLKSIFRPNNLAFGFSKSSGNGSQKDQKPEKKPTDPKTAKNKTSAKSKTTQEAQKAALEARQRKKLETVLQRFKESDNLKLKIPEQVLNSA